MQKYFPAFILLFTLSVLLFPVRSAAQDATAESTSSVLPVTTSTTTTGATSAPSVESVSGMTAEAVSVPSSTESTAGKTSEAVSTSPSTETVSAKTGEATVTTTVTVTAPATTTATAATTAPTSSETRSVTAETMPAPQPPAEGSGYKGVPWGADFGTFKTVKGYAGNPGPQSAVMVDSPGDNDIALLLGVPVSGKEANGGQRVMFEYLPQKFTTTYFEPDDTYYIFYNDKFAMTFSYINSSNFDLYRDTFYKKYERTGNFSKKYELGTKSYQLQAGIFTKGSTEAFLIKNLLTNKKETSMTAKIVFAYNDLFNTIRKEIEGKLAADKLSGSEKIKQQLEKDLNKIQ